MSENRPYRVDLNEATMRAIDEEFGENAARFIAIVDEYISLNIEKGEFTSGFMGKNPSMLHMQTVNSNFVSRHLTRLCESILLGICRLTDRYEDKHKQKPTTGISGLPEMITGSDHTEIKQLVTKPSTPPAQRSRRSKLGGTSASPTGTPIGATETSRNRRSTQRWKPSPGSENQSRRSGSLSSAAGRTSKPWKATRPTHWRGQQASS